MEGRCDTELSRGFESKFRSVFWRSARKKIGPFGRKKAGLHGPRNNGVRRLDPMKRGLRQQKRFRILAVKTKVSEDLTR